MIFLFENFDIKMKSVNIILRRGIIMKLGNNGWGYRVFVMILTMFSSLILIANHYLQLLLGK